MKSQSNSKKNKRHSKSSVRKHTNSKKSRKHQIRKRMHRGGMFAAPFTQPKTIDMLRQATKTTKYKPPIKYNSKYAREFMLR